MQIMPETFCDKTRSLVVLLSPSGNIHFVLGLFRVKLHIPHVCESGKVTVWTASTFSNQQ